MSSETWRPARVTSSETEHFLTEDEVVARYRQALAAGTLRNWRSKGIGPPFIRIGKAVLYARADLEAWEARQRSRPQDDISGRPAESDSNASRHRD